MHDHTTIARIAAAAGAIHVITLDQERIGAPWVLSGAAGAHAVESFRAVCRITRKFYRAHRGQTIVLRSSVPCGLQPADIRALRGY